MPISSSTWLTRSSVSSSSPSPCSRDTVNQHESRRWPQQPAVGYLVSLLMSASSDDTRAGCNQELQQLHVLFTQHTVACMVELSQSS
jgi:hypothetical protein